MPTGVQVKSSPTNIVSPFIAEISPTSLINVDSEYVNEVEINGVNAIFKKTLTMTETATLLNGITVAGLYHDYRLDKVDPHLGSVTLDESFNTIMELMVNSAVENATNVGLDKWLANELRAAFVSTFGSALGGAVLPLDIMGENINVPTKDVQAASPTDPATDAGTTDQSTSVMYKSRINGFSVDVNTDAAATATAIKAVHEANGSRGAKLLFQLIPRTSVEKYMDNAHIEAGYKEVYPSTDAFPLLQGDKLTFVVDVDVHTAGADENAVDASVAAEDVALPAEKAVEYGASSFSMNLANRRVAFEITIPVLAGGAAGDALPVGNGAALLRQRTGPADAADPNAATRANLS
jgi:hypothetical protein